MSWAPCQPEPSTKPPWTRTTLMVLSVISSFLVCLGMVRIRDHFETPLDGPNPTSVRSGADKLRVAGSRMRKHAPNNQALISAFHLWTPPGAQAIFRLV